MKAPGKTQMFAGCFPVDIGGVFGYNGSAGENGNRRKTVYKTELITHACIHHDVSHVFRTRG